MHQAISLFVLIAFSFATTTVSAQELPTGPRSTRRSAPSSLHSPSHSDSQADGLFAADASTAEAILSALVNISACTENLHCDRLPFDSDEAHRCVDECADGVLSTK